MHRIKDTKKKNFFRTSEPITNEFYFSMIGDVSYFMCFVVSVSYVNRAHM